LEHITTVEINSGVLAFPVPLFTSGGLGLVILVLVLVLQAAVLVLVVLRIWSCLHHWYLAVGRPTNLIDWKDSSPKWPIVCW